MWIWRQLVNLILLFTRKRAKQINRLTQLALHAANDLSDSWTTLTLRKKRDERPILPIDSHESVAVVVQGPILHTDRFTLEALRRYRISVPGAKLILSTWDTEDAAALAEIEALGVTVVLSSLPVVKGPQNTNYQVRSSLAGIQKASELGAEFVLKTRTDQRLDTLNAGDFLAGLVRTFDVPEHVDARGRIVIVGFGTYLYVPNHTADFLSFGFAEDMLRLWSLPLYPQEIEPSRGGLVQTTLEEFLQGPVPEIRLCEHYLKSMGQDATRSIENWWRVLAEVFIVVDRESLGLFWPKYSYPIEQADWQRPGTVRGYCSFADWLTLVRGERTPPVAMEDIAGGPVEDDLRGAAGVSIR